MRRKSREVLEEAPINLTPLIDVVFVILIMFIVIAPLLEIDQIKLASSTTGKEPAAREQSMVIHVHADNSLKFNNQRVTLPQLERLLAQAKKRYPTGHPQVFHDKNARFGTYQSVKNAVESAGFAEMDILLKPQGS